jgi:ribose transport system ATP-binding protein
MTQPVLLKASNLVKRFPGVTALKDVSIEVGECEVVGLVGANGSGKSTLLKVLSGLYQVDEGQLEISGRPVVFHSAAEARAAGIGMVFQEQSLLPNLSVAENIMLGVERDAFAGGAVRWRALEAAAGKQLAKIGASISPSALTETLSLGERQMVELAKALATEENVQSMPLILLDEATSMLSAAEVRVLFEQIRRLRRRASVIFVSHRLDEILEVCDRVYVLRDGACVAERERGEWVHEEFLSLMVGGLSGEDYFQISEQKDTSNAVRLTARGLTKRDCYRDINFDLRVGEVLGICGIEGSGREPLLRTLFSAELPDVGALTLDGRALRPRTPADAVAAGIGFIPAERSKEASFADLTVAENVTIASLEEVCAAGVLSRDKERGTAENWISRLKIRTPSPTTLFRNLSGGNQQKAIFARWMAVPGIRVLLLDHPTRGLDVAAKTEIYGIIRRLAAAGASIILLSDSIEETIALSHAILVMRDGAVTARIDAPANRKPAPVDIVGHMV